MGGDLLVCIGFFFSLLQFTSEGGFLLFQFHTEDREASLNPRLILSLPCLTSVSALRRMAASHKFEANLVYIANSRLAWLNTKSEASKRSRVRPSVNKQQQKDPSQTRPHRKTLSRLSRTLNWREVLLCFSSLHGGLHL